MTICKLVSPEQLKKGVVIEDNECIECEGIVICNKGGRITLSGEIK